MMLLQKILMTCVIKDDGKFYPQTFLEESLCVKKQNHFWLIKSSLKFLVLFQPKKYAHKLLKSTVA